MAKGLLRCHDAIEDGLEWWFDAAALFIVVDCFEFIVQQKLMTHAVLAMGVEVLVHTTAFVGQGREAASPLKNRAWRRSSWTFNWKSL